LKQGCCGEYLDEREREVTGGCRESPEEELHNIVRMIGSKRKR
jgi:hypothetical protein